MAAVTFPSEDPRELSAHCRGLEMNLETSSGRRPARQQKAIPRAHLIFVIDCARGKQISLAAPPGPPRTPSPKPGPAVPPMKTYILLCGEKQSPNLTREAPLGGRDLAPAGGPCPGAPCRGTTAQASPPGSPGGLAEAPEAKGSPVKAVSSRSSAWGTVIGSLKALSSCVCAQAD